jgi:hypothetical protein
MPGQGLSMLISNPFNPIDYSPPNATTSKGKRLAYSRDDSTVTTHRHMHSVSSQPIIIKDQPEKYQIFY